MGCTDVLNRITGIKKDWKDFYDSAAFLKTKCFVIAVNPSNPFLLPVILFKPSLPPYQ